MSLHTLYETFLTTTSFGTHRNAKSTAPINSFLPKVSANCDVGYYAQPDLCTRDADGVECADPSLEVLFISHWQNAVVLLCRRMPCTWSFVYQQCDCHLLVPFFSCRTFCESLYVSLVDMSGRSSTKQCGYRCRLLCHKICDTSVSFCYRGVDQSCCSVQSPIEVCPCVQ